MANNAYNFLTILDISNPSLVHFRASLVNLCRKTTLSSGYLDRELPLNQWSNATQMSPSQSDLGISKKLRSESHSTGSCESNALLVGQLRGPEVFENINVTFVI